MPRNDTLFNQDQQNWIKDQFSEYVPKLGISKLRLQNQPEPKDDADLKEWLDGRWKEFKTKFSVELKGESESEYHTVSQPTMLHWMPPLIDVYLQKFMRKFYNKKHHLPKRDQSAAAAGLLLRAPTNPFKARSLFLKAVTRDVNEYVNEKRNRDGLGKTAHPGLFQQEVSARWDALTSEERAEWAAQAEAKNKAAHDGLSVDT